MASDSEKYLIRLGSEVLLSWNKPLMRWQVMYETNLRLNNQIHWCVVGVINWQWSDLTLLLPLVPIQDAPPIQHTIHYSTTPHNKMTPYPVLIAAPNHSNTSLNTGIPFNTLPLVPGQNLKGCQLTTCRRILFIDVTTHDQWYIISPKQGVNW